MLTFFPEFEWNTLHNVDVTLLIDASNSMKVRFEMRLCVLCKADIFQNQIKE